MKKLIDFINENKQSEGVKEFYKYFKDFDITNIPLNIRKQKATDFKKIFDFSNDISEEYLCSEDVIDESKTSNVQVEATQIMLESLKEKYKLNDYNFLAYDPNNVCIVKIDKIPNYLQTTHSVLLQKVLENVQIIKTEICNRGYYVVSEKSYYDKETDIEWVRLIFDPVVQENISKQVLNHVDILYHCSPIHNKISIEKNGIIPSNEGRVYTYNNKRVYLFTAGPKDSSFVKMMTNTTKNRKKLNKDFDGKYNIYTILSRKLPKDIKFYFDPHGTSKNCIYTTTTIPYSSIIDVEETQY